MCALEGYSFSKLTKNFRWFYGNFEKSVGGEFSKNLFLVPSVDCLYGEGSKYVEFITNPTNNTTLEKDTKNVQS